MTDLLNANFFRDRAVQDDPYPYFDALRAAAPVWQEPNYGVFMVTGHDEALAVYNDFKQFSSCNVVSGPFMKFPEPFEGDDVTDVIERNREMLPFSDQLPAFDPPRHDEHRALMMRLLTPGRLRENEEFMERLADRRIDLLVAAGTSEFITEYAAPFALLVIADLEGVPESDHAQFAEGFAQVSEGMEHKPLEFLYAEFSRYIEDRRRQPPRRHHDGDGHGHLPRRHHADGGRRGPAGREPVLRRAGDHRAPPVLRPAPIADRPDIQQALRDDRDLIPNFIEETLRFESPLRAQFRMAKVRTTVAGVDIPAGATMMLLPGAANRDPALFDDPASSGSTARTPSTTSPSATASTTAPAPTWPAPRAGSPSAACSTAPRPSRSTRPPTAPPTPAATSSSRPTSCAASPPSSSTSPRAAYAGSAEAPSISLSWPAGGPAVVPPSTGRTMPVIWAERSLARNTVASATSSTVPCRGRGWVNFRTASMS